MRKMASIRKIDDIRPIEGADAIEAARVNGWWVVVAKKDEFKVGDLCIYLEIDSFVPYQLAPFLCKGKEPREFNGVKGEQLRTIKLRGQLSQGLILPMKHLTNYGADLVEGSDLTEQLGIQKWEKPISAQLAGMARGNFPSFIRKTDQERIQNMLEVLDSPYLYQMTTKLDGSSMTVYWNESQMGVCSRNIDLKLDQEGNTFVDTAKRIFGERVFDGLAIQGELMGPGVQGNRENLTQREFFVFDIWDIYEQRYRSTAEVTAFCGQHGLRHVPVLNGAAIIEGLTLDDLLEEADNTKSLNHPVAEGIVFKRIDGGESFKVISNKFLLGEK
jgi:RNA ligase (TIGR02306 family)